MICKSIFDGDDRNRRKDGPTFRGVIARAKHTASEEGRFGARMSQD